MFTFTDKIRFYKNKFFMIQANNTTSIDETDGLPMPRRIWAVVSIGFALCMSVLDVNIINIVLPTLSHDFGTSPAVTTWIINGYQLAIVVSLLSFSSLGEIIGYRKVFLSGIGLFCITSLICALSDSFWTLTIARIFQGFSASAITSVNTAQLRYVYPKSQIGRGMGINAMVVAISAAAGPSVASGILSIASWHWLFLINLPVGALAIFFSLRWLGADADGVRPEQPRNFDLPGFVLIAGAISALLLGLTGVSQGEGLLHSAVGLPLLAGLGLLALFAALPSTRDPARAIVDVSLFRHRSVTAASCAMFFAGGTLYAAQFLFPLYWQQTLGSSALEAALMLLPQGVGAPLTRTAAGKLTDAHGGRVVATGGFLACVITTIPFLFLGNSAGILLYLILFVRGLSIGMLIVPITTSAFRGLPDGEVSRATVIIRACQQVGGAFGTAAVAATAASTAQSGGQAAAEAPGDFMASFLVLAIVSAAGASLAAPCGVMCWKVQTLRKFITESPPV